MPQGTTGKGGFILVLLFVLSTLVILAGAALNVEPGVPVFYDMAEPLLASLGLNEKLGFSAAVLIGFGPIVALALTLYSLTKTRDDH